jgi:hypothetical protein
MLHMPASAGNSSGYAMYAYILLLYI